jgi:hypothetical protein
MMQRSTPKARCTELLHVPLLDASWLQRATALHMVSVTASARRQQQGSCSTLLSACPSDEKQTGMNQMLTQTQCIKLLQLLFASLAKTAATALHTASVTASACRRQ